MIRFNSDLFSQAFSDGYLTMVRITSFRFATVGLGTPRRRRCVTLKNMFVSDTNLSDSSTN